MVHTRRHAESHIWKVTHEMELTPGSWHVRMRAKNTVGWSAFSAQHDFVIKDNESDVDAYDELDGVDDGGVYIGNRFLQHATCIQTCIFIKYFI